MRIIFLVLITAISVFSQQGGYSNSLSVKQGEKLKFYISTGRSSYNIKIYKLGIETVLVYTSPQLTGTIQPVPSNSYAAGCNWQKSFEMTIPAAWQPGVYKAVFPVTDGTSNEIIFVVKSSVYSSHSNIVVILSTNTWQAYNNWGGKSLYDYNSTNGVKAVKVSFNRPFSIDGIWDYYRWSEDFIKWAEENNYQLEFAVDTDLDADPNFLSNYKVAAYIGHDEYFTRDERRQVENFVADGKKLIILSGNTMWWQIRFEDNLKTMVCYKSAEADPLTGIQDSLVTVSFFNHPVNDPENKIIGVSYRQGGFVNNQGYLPASEGYTDYAAFNTHHWVFNGTGLKEGDEYGYDGKIVGVEVDGVNFSFQNGIPKPSGGDGTPSNFRILSLSPAFNTEGFGDGHSTAGIYLTPNGGAVFNASTTNWTNGLRVDSRVSRITKNVFNQFIKGVFPPDIVSWSPSVVKEALINNDQVYLNKRDSIYVNTPVKEFKVYGEDPYNSDISYQWFVDGEAAGSGKDFYYANTSAGWHNVTAIAFNDYDTSSISWKVYAENPSQGHSVFGKIKYDNSVQSGIGNVTAKLISNSGYLFSTLTDDNGDFRFFNIPAGNYTLTGEGNYSLENYPVNSTDALVVLKYAASQFTLGSLRELAADVNNSLSANATDALLILKRYTGSINSFIKPDFIYESKIINVNSNLTGQDIRTIITGDANGSYTPILIR